MDNKKKIEIPFGAFDSELIRQEINIPNGFNAVIEGDKIILTRVESEDERTRKAIHIYLDWLDGRRDYQPKGDYTIKDMLAWLEKQGEQKPNYTTLVETGNGGINALVTRELSNSCDYEEKPADKVEPKFRVKYAGSEYNVLEIKEIAGDTYYGIEDEPNHIDYVLPDNCEIVSEQKSDWSEEDEKIFNKIIRKLDESDNVSHYDYADFEMWLIDLKEKLINI